MRIPVRDRANRRTYILIGPDDACDEVRAEFRRVAEEARERACVSALDGRPDHAGVFLGVAEPLERLSADEVAP